MDDNQGVHKGRRYWWRLYTNGPPADSGSAARLFSAGMQVCEDGYYIGLQHYHEREDYQGGSVSAGVEMGMSFLIGPSVSTSVSTSAEWSKTVQDTVGRSDTQTFTKNPEFQFGLTSGGIYAGVFTLDLKCLKYALNCAIELLGIAARKFELEVEVYDPIRDQNNIPQGLNEIMTIG